MKSSVLDSLNIAERRARVADALQLNDEILLVGAGEPVPLPEGTDQTYPFRAHPEYFYLTGVDSAGGVIAFDPQDRSRERWVFFVPDVTEAERTWEGRTQQSGRSLSALEPWLMARRGRPLVNLGERLRGVRSDEVLAVRAREQFTHVRRAKDTAELRLLRRAANATACGFSTRISSTWRNGARVADRARSSFLPGWRRPHWLWNHRRLGAERSSNAFLAFRKEIAPRRLRPH